MPDITPRLNFLIATWEGGGSVGPKLTVARKLVDAGHKVRVMSDACNAPEALATGARFVPWTRAPSRTDRDRESETIRDWAHTTPVDGLRHALLDTFVGPALGYAQDIIEELMREGAELVLASDFLFGVLAGCEAIGQRVAIMPCNSLMFPLPGAPLAGPGMDDPAVREQARQMGGMMVGLLDEGLPAFNAARQALALPPLEHLIDQFRVADKVLIGISRTFDFAPEPDPCGFAYVGPQLDESLWVDGWQSPWPDDDPRPLVLVSFSTTFQNHVAVLQRVASALGRMPVRALVTLGPTIRPHEIAAADNVQLVASAPHNAVLRQAKLVVTHGGHGTLARAMLARLPQLVLPHGRDQDGNAARLAAHGAGIALAPSASANDIEAALRRLLDEPHFAEAARMLGERVAHEAQGSRVVEEMESLAAPRFSLCA